MCGRFFIAEEDCTEDLRHIIDALNRRYNGAPPVKLHGEMRPTDMIPAVANSPSMNISVYPMQWGYTMPDGKPLFNARSETAAEKPLFRDGMLQRRCIIPASHYFEWEKRGTQKTKYAIDTGGSMIWLAGIYRREGSKAACTILTRESAEEIAFIHNRMPVILPRDVLEDWLNLRNDPLEILKTAQTNIRFRAM